MYYNTPCMLTSQADDDEEEEEENAFDHAVLIL